MRKLFCDVCEREITTTHQQYKVFQDKDVLSDTKAKVKISINASFVCHSTGFGGPPDLCMDCFVDLTDRFLDELKAFTRVG